MKDEADLLQWLPSIAFFGGLEVPTLQRIIAMLGVHHVVPEQEVCRQGEAGRALYLVRSGEVLVWREDEHGRRVKLVRLGPGEFFGEMALIDIQKRSASVTATRPALLYSLGTRDLLTLYNDDVPGYVMVIQNLARELSRRLRVTNARLHQLAADDEDEATLIRPAVSRRPR